MHPILFTIGSFPVRTYGLMIAIGFIIAVQVLRHLAKTRNQNPDVYADLAMWCLASGFIGARILYVITQWPSYAASPLDILKVWEGGLVFFGGLLLATPTTIYFIRKHHLNPWLTTDILSPPLVIAHAFGRLGCLGAGCCYGKPTHMPWGIHLDDSLIEPNLRGLPLHPTQIYESLGLFVIFFILLRLFKKNLRAGAVTLTYFMIYPVFRSVIEEFRGDDLDRGFIIPDWVSTSQFISLLVFLSAATLFYLRFVKNKKNAA